jgi:hypothetical protein
MERLAERNKALGEVVTVAVALQQFLGVKRGNETRPEPLDPERVKRMEAEINARGTH